MQQLHIFLATTGSIVQRLQALRGSLTYQWRQVTSLCCNQPIKLKSTCMLSHPPCCLVLRVKTYRGDMRARCSHEWWRSCLLANHFRFSWCHSRLPTVYFALTPAHGINAT